MTCSFGPDCSAPKCTGRRWRSGSSDPADVRAFLDDVKAYMIMFDMSSAQFGKAAAAVFKSAMREPCVLSL